MALKNKTVLVTGASGFVGGALARHLAEQGATVRALVRNRAKAAYIDGVAGIELVDGDLGNELSLRKAVQGCTRVFHVAAALGGSADHQAEVNVDGTRLLAAAAAQAGVKRFIHVSSIAIYGFGASLPDVITEDTPPAPSRYAYTATKRAAESVLRLIAAQTGMTYTIIRPGMIYGPRSNPWTVQMSGLATRFPVVPFIGDGRGHIAAVHIDDVVSMCALAAEHPSAAGQAFNCAADPGVTWRDFLTAYARHAGRSGRWLGIPAGLLRVLSPVLRFAASDGAILRDFPDVLNHHLRPVIYSTEKARRVLGWQSRWSIEDGLADAAAWLASR